MPEKEFDEATKQMIMEFQVGQQQMQSVMMQKESMKLQEIEIERALEELTNTKEKNAYKIIGGIMVSKAVEELKKDLEETKEAISIRTKSLEKSEEKVNNKLKELQEKLKEAIKE